MPRQTWILVLTMLAPPSCTEPTDADDMELIDEDDAEGVDAFRVAPLLHPSGVCRIEGATGWTYKKVKYYHTSNPGAIWSDQKCDPWEGTSECCEDKNPFGLTYEECKQLRHDPDCPVVGGDEWGPPPQQEY